jgi:hypothetical protein
MKIVSITNQTAGRMDYNVTPLGFCRFKIINLTIIISPLWGLNLRIHKS